MTAPQASGEEQEDDYDTIYSEPIEPSLFTNLVKESNNAATDEAMESESEVCFHIQHARHFSV